MPLEQQQYAAARAASAAQTGGGGRIIVTSTLRDRTPQPQEKPLEDAEVIWGKASNFSWGRRSDNTENGPIVQTSWSLNWPDYVTDPTDPTGDNPSAPSEPDKLPVQVYRWQEIKREEKVVRILGTPDGAFVDDARALVSTFLLPPAPNGQQQLVEMVFLKFPDENAVPSGSV